MKEEKIDPIDPVEEWQDSGWLDEVNDEIDRGVLATALERAATDPVIMFSNRYGPAADELLFPLIRAIMEKHGFLPLHNVRGLFEKIDSEWEEFIRLPEAQEMNDNDELELEFCEQFVEKHGKGFLDVA